MAIVFQTYLDRRLHPRVSAGTACVAFPGEVECIIQDISRDGARVQCRDPGTLGDCPIIVEWAGGRAYQCVVLWRHDKQAGLHFQRTCLLTGVVPAPFIGARDAWIASRLTRLDAAGRPAGI